MNYLTIVAGFVSSFVGLCVQARETWFNAFFDFIKLGGFYDFLVAYALIIVVLMFLLALFSFVGFRYVWIYPIFGVVLYFFFRSVNFLTVTVSFSLLTPVPSVRRYIRKT